MADMLPAVWIDRRKVRKGYTYRLRWVENGEKRTESCGRDRAYARDRQAAKRDELRAAFSGLDLDRTLSQLKASLATWMAGRSRITIRKTQASIQALIEHVGDRILHRIGREAIMEFRAARLEDGAAVPTVNKDLRQIKSALSYAVDAKWLRANPLLRWRGLMLREPELDIRVVEAAEFAALLAACNRERDPLVPDAEGPDPGTGTAWAALLCLGYYAGLRRAELAHLRWEAVDLDAGNVRVRNVLAGRGSDRDDELTKSRRNRTIPLRAAVAEALRVHLAAVPKRLVNGCPVPRWPHVFTWADGTPWSADWITHRFAELAKLAKIRVCTLHDLRRSFSTLAQRGGIDRSIVKDLGGWSSVAVVERHYTGEVSPVLREAMERLDSAPIKPRGGGRMRRKSS